MTSQQLDEIVDQLDAARREHDEIANAYLDGQRDAYTYEKLERAEATVAELERKYRAASRLAR